MVCVPVVASGSPTSSAGTAATLSPAVAARAKVLELALMPVMAGSPPPAAGPWPTLATISGEPAPTCELSTVAVPCPSGDWACVAVRLADALALASTPTVLIFLLPTASAKVTCSAGNMAADASEPVRARVI